MKFPETVQEHEAIPLQPTVYGWAKVLGHNGFFQPKRVTHKTRKLFRHLRSV